MGFSIIFLHFPIDNRKNYDHWNFPWDFEVSKNRLQVDEGFTSPRALSGGWLHQAWHQEPQLLAV